MFLKVSVYYKYLIIKIKFNFSVVMVKKLLFISIGCNSLMLEKEIVNLDKIL